MQALQCNRHATTIPMISMQQHAMGLACKHAKQLNNRHAKCNITQACNNMQKTKYATTCKASMQQHAMDGLKLKWTALK